MPKIKLEVDYDTLDEIVVKHLKEARKDFKQMCKDAGIILPMWSFDEGEERATALIFRRATELLISWYDKPNSDEELKKLIEACKQDDEFVLPVFKGDKV